jgi:hypothetical protein
MGTVLLLLPGVRKNWHGRPGCVMVSLSGGSACLFRQKEHVI